jgi:enoyl-CoA hydratase/carnithine racemase
MAASILVDRDGLVATITLNRAERSNALTLRLGHRQHQVIEAVDARQPPRVIATLKRAVPRLPIIRSHSSR